MPSKGGLLGGPGEQSGLSKSIDGWTGTLSPATKIHSRTDFPEPGLSETRLPRASPTAPDPDPDPGLV